ncbi:molecular chaperone HtpG [Breznakiellaceae bacterium SP9]
MAQHQFQTEVSQLLHLIIHSLYSNREIFLRELISNASDALDKLKYLTVAEDAYKNITFDARIDVSFNQAFSPSDEHGAKENITPSTISIADNGIGMNENDLIESLGTIARSGTKAFLEKLNLDAQKDSNLIGQFGVGFYSAFMVADRIEVISRKAGEEAAWKWSSDGKTGYEVEAAERDSHGTTVTLFLNEDGRQYASRWSLQDVIKRYSNHVAFPIYLTFDEKEYDDKGKEKATTIKTEQINSGTALWRRQKSDITEEDYKNFFKQELSSKFGGETEDPLFYLHTKAEGTLEYTTLFYIPKKAPDDMYRADYKPGVKLYVKRVFITDDEKELMPIWLRFVQGVIDSEDLPLNVSREILQQNKILLNIRNASVKKLLSEFKSLADTALSGGEEAKAKWETFIEQYNRPLKEGLYQDYANRETLEEIVRFKSSSVDGWVSFADYAGRMKEGQKNIYYISGGNEQTLKASPLLEAYREKDFEVLILTDEIDEWVIPQLFKYKDWELKSVNRSGADDEVGKKHDKDAEKEIQPVIEKIKKALGDKVKDVKLSTRLTDSPSCIVADENDPTIQMAQMMKAMGQTDIPDTKPILEINGAHSIVASLKNTDSEERIADIAEILLDQALLVEGLKIKDAADFVRRLNRLLSGIGA